MELPVQLVLNIAPISVNSLYRSVRGRNILSKQAREFKSEAQKQIKLLYTGNVLENRLRVKLIFYFPDNRRRDVDNYTKAILDSLTGLVFRDDSQIYELILRKQTGTCQQKIEIFIDDYYKFESNGLTVVEYRN